MNKERYNQIIDEVYKNYLIEDYKIMPNFSKEKMYEFGHRLTKEEFINKCKINTEFSERWGLKIEEKELSLEERKLLAKEILPILKTFLGNQSEEGWIEQCENLNVPTKLITVTYKDEKIEIYG